MTYISVVNEGLKNEKSEEEIFEILKEKFPNTNEKKLKLKLKPAIKYLKNKEK